MPTLRYEMTVKCSNCRQRQVVSIPKGSSFEPFRTIPMSTALWTSELSQIILSGYQSQKTGKVARLFCNNCGTRRLIHDEEE